MSGVSKAMGKLYKSYLFTVIVKDLKKLADIDFNKQLKVARKTLENIEWDPMLKRVGLTTYKPARRGFGTGMLFLAGAACGALAGMALAPMKGDELRDNMKRKMPLFKAHEVGGTQAPAQA